MVTRKKNGAPDSKHFEAPETVAKFEPVKQWLLKNCRKVSLSASMTPAGGETRRLAHRTRGRLRRVKKLRGLRFYITRTYPLLLSLPP